MRRENPVWLTGSRTWAIMLSGALLTACASFHESPDFERHRLSQLSEPFDRNDVVYFDVTFSANYPDDDSAAEAQRMQWLQQWLEQRKMCLDGHEVLKRRPFDMFENNPARYDIRYEVKCLARTEM